MEKARLPSPAEHFSYQKHRRELWTKILAPLLAAGAVIVIVATLTGIAAFGENSEVERWAAISTIWIILPIMVFGALALIILIAVIYGMAKLLALLPPHTGHAQRVVWRIEGVVRRITDRAVQPFLTWEGIAAAIKRLTRLK